MKRQRGKHSYSADRPIESKKQDILGRAKFASRLAEDIQTWSGSNSLVIGLYGAWGSGKSSVKNMVLEAIRGRKRRSLPIIDFNPWQLSGTGGIPAAFFRELGLALNSDGLEGDAKERAKKFKAYAKVLTLGGATTKILGKTMAVIGVPGGPIMEYMGAEMQTAGATVQDGSEALDAKDESAEKGLEAQKRELAELLADLPRPVLIVIDDIDRLSTEEILQVFQLVKANADFPRLIYLLLFEREIVAKALDQISANKGTEFLEKIVQVGYHIPHASPGTVQKVLFNGLDKYLDEPAISRYWEKQRWSNHYSDCIAPYFRNLRHVYRFLASFSFHAQHHRNKRSFEVNPLDLAAC